MTSQTAPERGLMNTISIKAEIDQSLLLVAKVLHADLDEAGQIGWVQSPNCSC